MGRLKHSSDRAWYLGAAPAAVSAWVVRLHWSRVAADLAVLGGALFVAADDFPLRRLAPIVAASAFLHGDQAMRLARGARIPRSLRAAAIAADIVLLTGLLELSGGPSNPFAMIYAVPVVLAAAALGRFWAILATAASATLFALLISWHLGELVPSHHRLIDFPTHLYTMWLALVLMAEVLGHFLGEASDAISHRERELAAMREAAAARERLMSLTTLAAGAAHELSTPLATIAVASRELERALARAPADPAWLEDARLIREQVDRCHGILDQMSGRAGGATVGDAAAPTELEPLFADLRRRLTPEQADRVRLHVPVPLSPIMVPRAGLAQVLLSLVTNALDASGDRAPVVLEGVEQAGRVQLTVRDEGSGMSAEVLRRVGEPFFTTKEPGRGLGLGLFLARLFAERCGGTLTLRSDHGTVATLELPLSPPTELA